MTEKEENYNWICEECKEENEPTYDICWKCSTESVIAKTKYKEFSKKENESIKKEEGEKIIHQEIKELEIQIEKSMKKYKFWLKPLTLFVVILIGGPLGGLLGYPFVLIFGEAGEFALFLSYVSCCVLVWKLFYGKIYGRLRDKRIKQLGFDKHKYYNQIK